MLSFEGSLLVYFNNSQHFKTTTLNSLISGGQIMLLWEIDVGEYFILCKVLIKNLKEDWGEDLDFGPTIFSPRLDN